jgi:hypothetical protein
LRLEPVLDRGDRVAVRRDRRRDQFVEPAPPADAVVVAELREHGLAQQRVVRERARAAEAAYDHAGGLDASAEPRR